MSAPIARSDVTRQLVNYLILALEPDVLVGRGTAPKAGGWSGGQPGSGTFVPYVVVKAGQATPIQQDSIGRQQLRTWSVPYRLSYSGRMESICDDTADLGRAAIVDFEGDHTFGGVVWATQKVDVQRLGSPTKNESTDPPFWDVTDDVSLWLARSLAQ